MLKEILTQICYWVQTCEGKKEIGLLHTCSYRFYNQYWINYDQTSFKCIHVVPSNSHMNNLRSKPHLNTINNWIEVYFWHFVVVDTRNIGNIVCNYFTNIHSFTLLLIKNALHYTTLEKRRIYDRVLRANLVLIIFFGFGSCSMLLMAKSTSRCYHSIMKYPSGCAIVYYHTL